MTMNARNRSRPVPHLEPYWQTPAGRQAAQDIEDFVWMAGMPSFKNAKECYAWCHKREVVFQEWREKLVDAVLQEYPGTERQAAADEVDAFIGGKR